MAYLELRAGIQPVVQSWGTRSAHRETPSRPSNMRESVFVLPVGALGAALDPSQRLSSTFNLFQLVELSGHIRLPRGASTSLLAESEAPAASPLSLAAGLGLLQNLNRPGPGC